MSEAAITVVGAGLAGCEAAWQAANRGVKVTLYEMKPKKFSPAHHSPNFAELVCSNSLRADRLENAVGLLKEEMRRLNSVIMRAADETRVPAGGALAVDREKFSQRVTSLVRSHPLITVKEEEVTEIPDGYCVIASGPLTSDALSDSIAKLTGQSYLHFFDAAAPIVEFDSINMEKAYFAARYGRGGDDYINCPMNEEEYEAFYQALITAETAPLKEFDEKELKVFEGCMPVEVMAKRGHDTLLFGPLKPVGLPDPRTGKVPYAVVQLRRDNAAGSLFNIVGFQTHLKFGEQKRVFSMIPGLENAVFARYGVMHRNTYLDSPALLDRFYRLKSQNRIFFAGQITGVEGYVESASSGLAAGISCARAALGMEPADFGRSTAIGSLGYYISSAEPGRFQPMNINFGIMPPLEEKIRDKREKYRRISERALKEIDAIAANL
ncbi:Methylenetetrahydrofolate-tRNA-(uracil-5-)-methyltransferase TrmFO [[Clostridium] cellulosi]|uniref:Methylenetetrahydrofolate--tRNA-(uracil-5-)-methyltransferase TrmFO n=1 Tax=[Clostridium] cellulosi TaxID=29343 RepID=A0A078KMA9_9FIRM|nr:MAG: FADH(2)-oxidizing methylenetetrahydrofolate--tRNA-(uracil(54)-C(5))-methyltransferase TrmFO [[Clostridium] cellulosi]CDZ23603.1 Methylenetetrahydrofolate-tRNA-(uracil-5-)-methyltransferase TrmFO [[Clostridium] cellulosi]